MGEYFWHDSFGVGGKSIKQQNGWKIVSKNYFYWILFRVLNLAFFLTIFSIDISILNFVLKFKTNSKPNRIKSINFPQFLSHYVKTNFLKHKKLQQVHRKILFLKNFVFGFIKSTHNWTLLLFFPVYFVVEKSWLWHRRPFVEYIYDRVVFLPQS